MKQEEKNQLSKERILNAAIAEFGTKTYENASLNTICNENGISKGLIYHYFKNKDELYLCCVEICFDKLTQFLASKQYDFTNFLCGINKYFTQRYYFFHKYPYLSHIFFNAILQPPPHLEKQIKALKRDFDAQGTRYYKTALTHINLHKNISLDEAMEYFMMFQEAFHSYYGRQMYNTLDMDCLIDTHEIKLSKLLTMMLYGIAKEEINL